MKNLYFIATACLLFSATICFAQPGTLDSSFGTNGEVSTTIMLSSDAKSVTIQDNGKILVAGSCSDGLSSNFALARYKPNGKLDSSFGTNGKVITDFGGDDFATSITIQLNGKIIVAGYSRQGFGNSDFALARYKHEGVADSSFGIDGKVITDLGGIDCGRAAAIQLNGKIVVAGYTINVLSGNMDLALVRYKRDGRPDKTFGVNGKVITDFNGRSNGGRSIAVQQDGRIIVAGFNSNGLNDDFAVARFKLDGELDSSFGIGGKVITDLGGDDFGQSVALQADGSIIVAGTSDYNFAMVRYKATGKLDLRFGDRGKVIDDFGSFDYGQSVAIQTNGKILLAGVSARGSGYDFALARYRTTGKMDSVFGNAGKVTWNFGSTNYECSIALQADGKIVQAGGSGAGFIITRYQGDNNSYKLNTSIASDAKEAETRNSPNVLLFPNPVKDVLHVEGMSSSEKTISVLDLQGRELKRVVSSNENYSLDVSGLPAGIYFVRIDEGGRITRLKFIK